MLKGFGQDFNHIWHRFSLQQWWYLSPYTLPSFCISSTLHIFSDPRGNHGFPFGSLSYLFRTYSNSSILDNSPFIKSLPPSPHNPSNPAAFQDNSTNPCLGLFIVYVLPEIRIPIEGWFLNFPNLTLLCILPLCFKFPMEKNTIWSPAGIPSSFSLQMELKFILEMNKNIFWKQFSLSA